MLVNKLLIILVIIVLDSTLKTFYKLFTFSNRNMVGISQNKIAHQKFVSRIFVVCRGRFFQIFFVVSQIIRMLGRSYLEVPLYLTLSLLQTYIFAKKSDAPYAPDEYNRGLILYSLLLNMTIFSLYYLRLNTCERVPS